MGKGIEGYLSGTKITISIFNICDLLGMVNAMEDPIQNELWTIKFRRVWKKQRMSRMNSEILLNH